ncbi:hypothetical protein [Brumicola blandensis]|uniref:Uncharacterized protein n=1 Tax=Brumicola blandensis TaxID=3075611 RepID=A0AAW8QX16_9ALTE|nr:hypothetical protein [Alteromonas sp. W409]MDT0581703.1 hypothetical protein [Alteromonas sp. W409]
MITKLKLEQGEELKHERSRTKGTMAQTDIECYSVINSKGEVVGSVVYEDHTSLNGFKRTQHVTQKSSDGKIIVQESW